MLVSVVRVSTYPSIIGLFLASIYDTKKPLMLVHQGLFSFCLVEALAAGNDSRLAVKIEGTAYTANGFVKY